MLKMKIELSVNISNYDPRTEGVIALKALADAIKNASVDKPAIGGDLFADDGRKVATYFVSFDV